MRNHYRYDSKSSHRISYKSFNLIPAPRSKLRRVMIAIYYGYITKAVVGMKSNIIFLIIWIETIDFFKNDLVKRPEDALAIIEVYREDFPMALEMIKKAILQGKEENTRKYADLIPADNREHNIKLLRQLSGNVDKYISINAVFAASKAWNSFNQGLTGVSASMDSMTEFCENRLNDDLSLIN